MAQEKANPKTALWDRVKTTDQKHTKTQSLEGRQVTSINGMYVVQRATEEFGPIGQGWGYEILVDRFDQGAPITIGKGDEVQVIAHEIVHTIQIKLWYAHDGGVNHVIQYGHTPFVRKSQYGAYTDFDAPKKSLTDAIKKCLSLIGFCADVHMGMFEDEIYLEGLALEKRLDEAGGDSKKEILQDARAKFREWLDSQIAVLDRVPNATALGAIKKNMIDQARAKALVVNFNPEEIQDRIEHAAEARLQWLTENPTPPARPITKE